jgi:hypothetical protein
MPPSPSLPPPSFAIEPEAILFADDGFVPNNQRLPFVIYRGAIDLIGVVDPEEAIEKVFRRNGWGDMWRNGIYPYIHYHSMISTKAWASPAARRVYASAATRARRSSSPRATSRCCRPAPGISACRIVTT